MNINNAKQLGAYRFQCEPDDIKVTVDSDGLVEIMHKPSKSAVYYFIADLDDEDEDED